MQVDDFKHLIGPVIGGLGIVMLGLERMSDGVQRRRGRAAQLGYLPLTQQVTSYWLRTFRDGA